MIEKFIKKIEILFKESITFKYKKIKMNSIEGITLYIKRAEEHHTKEYIVESFSKNDIGKVSNTTFIKKYNDNGNSYNGVIVEFERWTMSPNVKKLFDR